MDPAEVQPPPFAAEAHRSVLRGADLLAMILGWLVLLGLAIFFAQRIAVTGPAGMSLPRATFFILSAASLTGFEMTWASPGAMTPGHASLWTLAVALTSLLSLYIATAAMARASGWDWGRGRIALCAALFLAALCLIAFLAELAGGAGWRSSAWNALMVATGAGLLSEASASSPALLWCARFPIAALAAIGPFVLLDVFRARSSLSQQSRLTSLALPAAFMLAIAFVVAAQGLAGQDILPAATAAVDARGPGFTDDSVRLTPPARWALIPVLLLGDAHGGIGGGLKAVTAAVLVIGVVRMLRHGTGAGRTFAIAAIWLVGLAVLFTATFILLLHTSPQLRPDRAAILAAAACGNAGISIDPLSVAGDDAYVLAAAMLLGRALPWIVLWWSATRGDEPLAIG